MTNQRTALCRYCYQDAVDAIRDGGGRLVQRLCRVHAARYREWLQHVESGGTGPTPLSGIVWPPHEPVFHKYPIDPRFRAWGTSSVCDCCLRHAKILRDGVSLCVVHETLTDDEVEALRRPDEI